MRRGEASSAAQRRFTPQNRSARPPPTHSPAAITNTNIPSSYYLIPFCGNHRVFTQVLPKAASASGSSLRRTRNETITAARHLAEQQTAANDAADNGRAAGRHRQMGSVTATSGPTEIKAREPLVWIRALRELTFCQFVLPSFFHWSVQLYGDAKKRHMTKRKHLGGRSLQISRPFRGQAPSALWHVNPAEKRQL